MSEPEVRTIQLSASANLWAKFDEWRVKQGCTSLTEAIRTAMREVTNFEVSNEEAQSDSGGS